MPTISVNMLCLLTLPRSWRTTRHSQIFWPWNVWTSMAYIGGTQCSYARGRIPCWAL